MSRPRRPILICETNCRDADILSFVIETRGYFNVTRVSCAYDAIATMLGVPSKFCLVLTNQSLYGSDGIELSRRIKQLWPDERVVVYNNSALNKCDPHCAADAYIHVLLFRDMGELLERVHDLAARKRGPKSAPETSISSL